MSLLTAEALALAPPRTPEAALIERAREMDASAWDELYSTHYGAIYRYISFRISGHEASEDLAAEVFLVAVRGIARYRYRGTSFRAWLYRIAHNVTVDERKRLARRGALEAPPLETPAEPSGPDFAPGLLARRDLDAALARLTDDQQQVVILRFLEGLALAEVATVMGRPAGAIKALQHRAMLRMRGLLTGEVV